MSTPSRFSRFAFAHIGEAACLAGLFCAPSAMSTALHAQQLSVEKVWEVGSIDGPAETIWSRISDAAIFAGHVYVADIEIPAVRRFNMQGVYRGDVGRQGQGPGEFVRPASLTVTRDTLRAYDVMQNRWTLVDKGGTHIRTTRPVAGGRFFRRVWRSRNGLLVGETSLVSTRLPSQSISSHFIVAWDSTSPPDTIAEIPGNPFWTKRRGLDSLVMVTTNTLGADGGAWVLGDSALVVVNGVTSRATIFALESTGLRKVVDQALPGRRRRLDERDRQTAIDWYYWRVGIDSSDSTIEEFVLPEWWSAWTAVRSDEAGKVWIRRGGASYVDRSAGEVWLRWVPPSTDFRELRLPPGVEAIQFGEGHVVGVRRDSLGVEYLALYRIQDGST